MTTEAADFLRPLTRAELAALAERRFVDGGDRTGLLLADLIGFDHTNATLGYRAGEALLAAACQGLREAFPGPDQVVPVGHGQLAVFVPDLKHPNHALLAASKVQRCLEALERTHRGPRFRPTLGVAVFPDHGATADQVLQCADQALGETSMGLRPVQMLAFGVERPVHPLARAEALEHAIRNNELQLHFQPQVIMQTQQRWGAEALCRWEADDGPVSPEVFIPLAETCGLIRELTTWTLNAALKQWRKWQPAWPNARVAVNLSASVLHDQELVPQVQACLGIWRVPPECLVLEVTESALMANPDLGLETLRSLQQLGVRLSIDDFGTGYSSMSYLSRFPLHELKIDRSFVMTMSSDSSNRKIVRTVIDLAHKLGLEVVAEGIEQRDAFDTLVALGCERGQGYWIGKPGPASELLGTVPDSAAQAGGRVREAGTGG
ncbi:MAG: GGDEF domain-containing phosphodiesterase [Pseudomonadota bacterium]